MARTSNRRWKGCQLCKPHKHAGNGQAVRKPASELRRIGKKRRVSRHDLGDDWRQQQVPAGPVGQPPAWLEDPTGRHDHRWWDGSVWTTKVSDGGVQSDEADAPPPPPPA
jgi:hypothetical protein